MTSIGVAIVTHNSAASITACIESVRREGVHNICVADSASSDDTIKILRNMGQPCVSLKSNLGFGHAANIAVNNMNTDYVLFLNPDAVLVPGSLIELRNTFSEYSQAGIAGALLVDNAGAPEIDAYGNDITLMSIITRHFLRRRAKVAVREVDWVSGGAFLVKRSVFQQVGGFDEKFFLYWEDIDLCKRVRSAGFAVYINTKAKAIHQRGASSTSRRQKTRLYDASANRYFQKHSPLYIWYLQRALRNIYRLLRPLAR